jgi:hypothetical protein
MEKKGWRIYTNKGGGHNVYFCTESEPTELEKSVRSQSACVRTQFVQYISNITLETLCLTRRICRSQGAVMENDDHEILKFRSFSRIFCNFGSLSFCFLKYFLLYISHEIRN